MHISNVKYFYEYLHKENVRDAINEGHGIAFGDIRSEKRLNRGYQIMLYSKTIVNN